MHQHFEAYHERELVILFQFCTALCRGRTEVPPALLAPLNMKGMMDQRAPLNRKLRFRPVRKLAAGP
jgi:hypothetical protein